MEQNKGKELQKKLVLQYVNGGLKTNKDVIQKAYEFCEEYKNFLNLCKTERESVRYATAAAENKGFVAFDRNKKYQPGDKVYLINRGKSIILAIIGKAPIDEGVKIVASHIDCPRLDLKPRPVYEESQLSLLKTHYYGGIKKYQWSAVPLALHGLIVKKNGEALNIVIGEEPGDPVFCVTDLLPHLAAEQMKRTLSDGIKGEELNVLAGSLPYAEDSEGVEERVKLNLLSILYDKYGIIEEDLISADIEIVPAYKASDVGIDRSMIGAYGHDDRVCAFTSLMAALETESPLHTTVTVLADREEIGSEGNTGLRSHSLRYFIADLAMQQGVEARTVLSNSSCLSADVNAAFDPTFSDVFEKNNSSYINYGVVLTKYTGSRGKSMTSEATAEYMGRIRELFDKNEIIWQVGELGKVDAGGGGTVAMFIAELDVDVVDVGVPVLSMHAPFEVVSKIDTFMTYRAFKAFLND